VELAKLNTMDASGRGFINESETRPDVN